MKWFKQKHQCRVPHKIRGIPVDEPNAQIYDAYVENSNMKELELG